MWLFTKTGFYSVVNHDTQRDAYLVRARTEADLSELLDNIEGADPLGRRPTIEEDPSADYRWRTVVPKAAFIAEVVDQLVNIDYETSVKDEIDKGDHDRHLALLNVWTAMHRLQTGTPAWEGRDWDG